MTELMFNDHKLCEVSQIEYEALRLLLPYWGLQFDQEDGTEIIGALSTFMLGIHGLSQESSKELIQLLNHTGILVTIEDHIKCNQRLYVDFHENHPMPLAIKTPDQQLYYLNPSNNTTHSIQATIHKGITLKRKNGPLYLAVQPIYRKQIAEWISYLVIQTFLRAHFKSLSIISEEMFEVCVQKVLSKINTRFAEVQYEKKITERPVDIIDESKEQITVQSNSKVVKTETVKKIPENNPYTRLQVPPIKPFSASGSLITENAPKTYQPGILQNRNVEPIKPFKSNKSEKQRPIQPFPTNLSDAETSVIRPFQFDNHTPSSNREYTNKTSQIFKQRRDGK